MTRDELGDAMRRAQQATEEATRRRMAEDEQRRVALTERARAGRQQRQRLDQAVRSFVTKARQIGLKPRKIGYTTSANPRKSKTIRAWNIDGGRHCITKHGEVLVGNFGDRSDSRYGDHERLSGWNLEPLRDEDITEQLVDMLIDQMGRILVDRRLPAGARSTYLDRP